MSLSPLGMAWHRKSGKRSWDWRDLLKCVRGDWNSIRRPGSGCTPSVVLSGLAVVGARMAVRASGRPILDDESRYAPKIVTIAGHYDCSNSFGNRRDPQIVVLHVRFGADQRLELSPS